MKYEGINEVYDYIYKNFSNPDINDEAFVEKVRNSSGYHWSRLQLGKNTIRNALEIQARAITTMDLGWHQIATYDGVRIIQGR